MSVIDTESWSRRQHARLVWTCPEKVTCVCWWLRQPSCWLENSKNHWYLAAHFIYSLRPLTRRSVFPGCNRFSECRATRRHFKSAESVKNFLHPSRRPTNWLTNHPIKTSRSGKTPAPFLSKICLIKSGLPSDPLYHAQRLRMWHTEDLFQNKTWLHNSGSALRAIAETSLQNHPIILIRRLQRRGGI